MDKKDVIAFFDALAPQWDAEMICDEQIIATILDGASMQAGQRVLDVACGTGIMIPHYLARGAVLFVEWPDRAGDLIPTNAWHISFTLGETEESRSISFRRG